MDDILYRHKLLVNWIPILLAFLTIASIGQWLNISLGNTTIWWIIETIFLFGTYLFAINFYYVESNRWSNIKRMLIVYFYKAYKKRDKFNLIKSLLLYKIICKYKVENIKYPIPVLVYLFLILLSIITGIFKAEYYWDWKALYNNSLIYLLPLVFVFFSIPEMIKKACQSWIKFAIFSFGLFLPFMQLECPAKFLFPFAFFILFWPDYNKKGIALCAIAFIFVFLFGTLGSRSSVIRFLTSLIFSILFLFKKYIHKSFFVAISVFLISIPIILLTLGITGQFNIFKIGDYIDIDVSVESAYSEGKSENLSSDTRTFLYAETIESALDYDYWLWGNSMSQGYYSPYFAFADEVEGRGMRYASEVGILNIFTNLGIIGVISYFIIFLTSIFKVFLFSKNKSLYIVALLVSFRWLFSFLEEFTRFDLNTIFLWIELAMCNSPYFLKMSDNQFKNWSHNLLMK